MLLQNQDVVGQFKIIKVPITDLTLVCLSFNSQDNN